MRKLTLELPPDVLDAMKLPPAEVEAELRKELAVALYRRGALGIGKARVLAQMTRWEFEDLLKDREVPRHYSESDLDDDIRYARDRQ